MLRWKQITAALLAIVLLATVSMSAFGAADSDSPFAPEDVVVFSGTDDALCILLRMDETIRGVTDALQAAYTPKSKLQPITEIDGAKIRVRLPQRLDERMEVVIPLPEFSNGASLRVQGLTDRTGATVERAITFDRTNYITDRIVIYSPDPDVNEQFQRYAQPSEAQNTIFCLVGDTVRFEIYTDWLQNRVQMQTDGVAMTAGEDGCSFTITEECEGTVSIVVAGNVRQTVKVCALATKWDRKRLLLGMMSRNGKEILGRHFHQVVALGADVGFFAFLLVPILYPAAAIAAPFGFLADYLHILFY